MESGMIRAMVRLLVAVGLGAFIILFVILPLGLRFGADNLGLPESALVARLGTAGLWPAFLLHRGLPLIWDRARGPVCCSA
jgi:hypothetical protein